MTIKCPKCNKPTIDANKWWLDRVLKFQNLLCANKIKYSKTAFQKKYARTEALIRKLDSGFYREINY